MSFAATVVSFGEWLPDQPVLNNPGLTVAENVIPADNGYKPYVPLVASSFTAISGVNGAFPYAQLNGTSGAVRYGLVVGNQTNLYVIPSVANIFSPFGATFSASEYWRFAQFDNVILATNAVDLPQRFTIGSTPSVLGSSPGTAPAAQHVGVIGQFVVLGDLNTGLPTDPYTLQWSGADDYDSFPAPNSATAIAQQSGAQIMPADGGTITGITNGDQFGIIFQRARISRMTYAGPPVVFQFDPVDVGRGCFYPNSLVQVKGLAYFASGLGFFVTDGVSVTSISDEKIDKYFSSLIGDVPSTAIVGAVDYDTKCVMWSLKYKGKILHYNYERKRWSVANETTDWLVNGIQRS
jgi:hypothetical protein